MQSIGKFVASQADYYTKQLTHSVGEDVPVLRGDRTPGTVDYYAGHVSPSRWMGSSLGRVGLEAGGPVDAAVFEGLMGHVTPAGEAMTVTRTHGNVAAFDHTFSAPKSVSLLYAYGDNDIRGEVTAAHQRAVSEAMRYMEERCSQSRLGVRYQDAVGNRRFTTRTLESEGYVAAGFDHFTSRANDPQVHTHVVVINRVWAGGGWRAIDAKRAYAHAKAGGTIYQAALRQELTLRLGVSWQPVINGQADIEGFTAELVRHFATRRTEIVEAVGRYVAETGGEAHRRVWQAFALETRQPKTHPAGEAVVTREMKDYGVTGDVVAHWHRRAADAPEDVVGIVRQVAGPGRPGFEPTPDQVEAAADRVVEWVSDRQAVFTERDLVAHVASLYGEGAEPAALLGATRDLLRAAQDSGQVLTVLPYAESGLILPEGVMLSADELAMVVGEGPGWVRQDGAVRFRALPGEARYTTRLQLEREALVLAAVNQTSPVRIDTGALEVAMTDRGLVDEQRQAMRHLGELDGRLVAVVGPGGSGKTYLIGAYADAIDAVGHPVIGVATSAAAARKLSEDLGERWTGTIAMLRHHIDTTRQDLPTGTVVVVDEASMVSTADLAWLTERIEACDGKLVLLGDPKQLPSIDSGGLFHRIVASGEQVVEELVSVNLRQRLDVDRQQLDRLRQGEIRSAVYEYQEAGRLHLGRDEYSTKTAMVDAWWNDTQLHGMDQVRMLASRHDEVWMLNQLARVRMQTDGQLTGPAVANRWGLEFRAGDRIVVRDNWYRHSDLRNGQTGTILNVNPDTGSLTFRRDLDGVAIDLPKRYLDRNVDHAYAQTIHTAQGQTYETTHLYADTGVRAEHGYTALSRARGETHLWVNDTPGPSGECNPVHGQALLENQVDVLVRRFTQSVIEPPATDQGLPVAAVTDRDLIGWRDRLGAVIYESPLMGDVTDKLVAVDEAIEHARQVTIKLGTSGSRAHVRGLETLRESFVSHAELRQEWLEENSGLLDEYSAVVEELQHRVNGRAAAYELEPPADILNALGAAPDDPALRRKRRSAVATYAETRLTVGPDIDLTDAVRLGGSRWRDAIHNYHALRAPQRELTGPVLRRVM